MTLTLDITSAYSHDSRAGATGVRGGFPDGGREDGRAIPMIMIMIIMMMIMILNDNNKTYMYNIHVCVCIHVCVYIYIYMCTYTALARGPWSSPSYGQPPC